MDAVVELEIAPGPEPGSYAVHVVRSLAGGEPSATIVLDVDDILASLPQLESSILASAVPARRVLTSRESALQAIGVRLFETVFAGRIAGVYRASVAVASEREMVPQLTLRLTAPELAALPWESLFDPEVGGYLSRKGAVIRRVSSPYAAEIPSVRAPLRILGIIASPRGLAALDVEAERERLEAALQDHLREARVELSWLEDVTWGGLHNKLLREPWHVVHFVGHGGYDPQSDEGLIALIGREGRADYVPASSLADLINEADPTPRLVVLNSCESGTTGTTDLFAGTAATLVRSGVHSVVAMQFAVSDYAALAFARGFYVALASGRRLGDAVRSGRIGILGTNRDTLEWVTPVLYLRGDDTRLLDAAPLVRGIPEAVGPAVGDAFGPVPGDAPGEGFGSVPAVPDSPVAAPAAAVPSAAPDPTPAAVPSATPETPATAAPPAPPTDEAPRGPRPRRRVPALPIVLGVVAVIVLAGLSWAGIALWGVFATDPGSTGEADGTTASVPASPTTYPQVQLDVPAAAAWTASGVACDTGDELRITATGTILHEDDPNSTVPPDGLLAPDGSPDPVYLPFGLDALPGVATASLIGSLDEAEPFFVGSDVTYVCPRAGELYLGINDVGLPGNSGAWQATVRRTVDPTTD